MINQEDFSYVLEINHIKEAYKTKTFKKIENSQFYLSVTDKAEYYKEKRIDNTMS